MTLLGWLLGKLTRPKPVQARAVEARKAWRADGKPGGPVTDPSEETTPIIGHCRHTTHINGKCAKCGKVLS